MVKKRDGGLVRLSNGVVENRDGVEAILSLLRELDLARPNWFEFLAQYVAGKMDELPDYVVAWLRSTKMVAEGDGVEFYDDVRDVITCCAAWTESRCRFDSRQLYHKDQSKLIAE